MSKGGRGGGVRRASCFAAADCAPCLACGCRLLCAACRLQVRDQIRGMLESLRDTPVRWGLAAAAALLWYPAQSLHVLSF